MKCLRNSIKYQRFLSFSLSMLMGFFVLLAASDTLAATSVISLSWDESIDAQYDASSPPYVTHYRIYYNTSSVIANETPILDDYVQRYSIDGGNNWTDVTIYPLEFDKSNISIDIEYDDQKVYFFAVKAVDNRGLESDLSNEVATINPLPEITTLEIDGESGSETVYKSDPNREVTARIVASDNISVSQYLVLEDDNNPSNGTFVDIPGGPAKNADFFATFTLSDSDGSRTLYAWVKDNFGDINETPVSKTNVVLDRVEPASTITAPLSGSLLNALASITGTSSDDRSGLAGIEIQVTNGTQYLNADGAWTGTETWFEPSSGKVPASWAHDTTGVTFESYNTYTIKSRATDNAGNVETPLAGISFDFDNDPPGGISVTYNQMDLSHVDESNLVISATFDENIDPSSPPQISIFGGGPMDVNASMTGSNDTWTYTVVVPTGDNTLYGVTVANFGDLARNVAVTPLTSNFTTDTIDTDGDGVRDFVDTDDDDDGMPDTYEIANGLDPLVDDRNGDIDGDGYTNYQEFLAETPQNNKGPDKPTLAFPADNTDPAFYENLELSTNLFSDTELDEHAQTVWQISKDATFTDNAQAIFTLVTANHLITVTVPNGVLMPSTLYHWRATFVDSLGGPSVPSDSFQFTTAADTTDGDSNGVPDEQSVDDWDIDGDGVNDISNTFKAVKTAVGNTQAGIESGTNVTGITALSAVDPATISDTTNKPANIAYGLLNFNITVQNPGDTAVVTVHFQDPLPSADTWYKYDNVNGWQDYSANAVISGDRKTVTLTLTDGGIGDADGVANGVIIDPSGSGSAGSGAPPATGGGGGGGGGCFIDTASSSGIYSGFVDVLSRWKEWLTKSD